MIYIEYILLALGVVYLSGKASKYVDLLDKKTTLSGAFIGGVMLSAVTSLPEVFTSVSSTLLLDKPGLCIGNILGSNLFNIAVLATLIIVFYKGFSTCKISKGHLKVSLLVALMYGAMLLNYLDILNFDIFTISITSIIIVIIYGFAIKYLSSENGEVSEEEVEDTSDLTVKQVLIRFAAVSVGIIALSILITFVTDKISIELNLGAGLAGAIFLGIATSLPELSSTYALFKIKNYNIAIGNIIGSNIFNFTILSLADMVYVGQGIYDYSDPKTVNLLVFGTLATFFSMIVLENKNKLVRIGSSCMVLVCYALFLIV